MKKLVCVVSSRLKRLGNKMTQREFAKCIAGMCEFHHEFCVHDTQESKRQVARPKHTVQLLILMAFVRGADVGDPGMHLTMASGVAAARLKVCMIQSCQTECCELLQRS